MKIKERWQAVFKRLPPDTSTPTFHSALVDGPLAVLGGLAGSSAVFVLLWLFGGPITNSNRLEYIKTALTITGFIGVVLAALYAYRKQRITESESHRADSVAFSDRYRSAVEQLAHSHAAVRLGGVVSLARLADDWKDQRQTCVDMLCAYIRMPMSDENDVQELEVRKSIVQAIRGRISRIGEVERNWYDCTFDFSGASFPWHVNLSFCRFRALHMQAAAFQRGADFQGSSFGSFVAAWADFHGAIIFQGCDFRSDAPFGGSSLHPGSDLVFSGANFQGNFDFSGALYADSHPITDGLVTFSECTFFHAATFQRRRFAEYTSFLNAEFRGESRFHGVEFESDVSFEGATFKSTPDAPVKFQSDYEGDRNLFPRGRFDG